MRTAPASLQAFLPDRAHRRRAAIERRMIVFVSLAFAAFCAVGLCWQVTHPLPFDPAFVLLGP